MKTGPTKRTWMATIKNNMIVISISKEMALNIAEWKKRIHVASPKNST